MKEYFDIYRNEGEVKATQVLKDKIFTELTKLCVHVPDKEDYDIYEEGCEIYRSKACKNLNLKPSPLNLIKAEQSIVQKLKNYFDEHLTEKEGLLKAASAYKQLKNKIGITEESLAINKISHFKIAGSILLFLIFMPFSLFGAILHGWLFWISNYSFRKKIKDPQFYASFSLGVGVILFTLWFVVLTVIFALIFKNWLFSLLLVCISIPSGIIAWEMWELILKVINRFKITRLKKSGNTDFKLMLRNRLYLVSVFDKIIN
jgi:hypothetical protein